MEPLSRIHDKVRRVLRFLLNIVPIAVAVGALISSPYAHAQFAAPPRPQGDFQNAAAFGLSYGVMNQRDADFWGWSVEYSRQLRGPWIGAVSVMWDRETEEISGAPDSEVDTYTAAATITYALSEKISLTTGLGKGFADTDNPSQSMKFTSGDLSTGIVIGYSTPGLRHLARDSVAFSLAYEYNFDKEETMVSFDVAFGWSF